MNAPELTYSAQMTRRRDLVQRASRRLAISPGAAFTLWRTGDDCAKLRARILEHLSKPAHVSGEGK